MGPPAPQPPPVGAMGPPQAPVAAAAPATGTAPAATAAQEPQIGPVVTLFESTFRKWLLWKLVLM